MKLIIDIDEDYYNIIQKNGGSNYVEDAVLNGTPLDDIKTEIKKKMANDYIDIAGYKASLEIIDKYIGERSEE